MSNAARLYIDNLIAAGKRVQVVLRGSQQPLGPGIVEKIGIAEKLPDGSHGPSLVVYKMLVPAHIQENQHARPRQVTVPMVFDADDVLVVIEEPINQDGEAAIVTPNGKSASGLYIPGS